MALYLTQDRQLPPFGRELLAGLGCCTPAAHTLGVGFLARASQPARLVVSEQVPASENPVARFEYRLMDPRTRDATRMLSAGAPMPLRPLEVSPFPYRPSEAPLIAKSVIPFGERRVLVLPPAV